MASDLIALAIFSFSGAFTPGPNNMMVMASGVNFGLRRSLPHLLGVGIGFPAMFLAVAAGFAGLLERFPVIHLALRALGAALLFYFAWRIARSGEIQSSETGEKPLTFLEAAAFQWANPKAWVYVISALGTFTASDAPLLPQATRIAAVFAASSLSAVSFWCLFGTSIRPYLGSGRRLRVFNWSMAIALAGSVVFVLAS